MDMGRKRERGGWTERKRGMDRERCMAAVGRIID